MRNLDELNRFRVTDAAVRKYYGSVGDSTTGVFHVPLGSAKLMIVASSGDGWDHVSVSLRNRCPTWAEMDHVKRLFFKPEETAMQLHPPEAEHVNLHQYTLHLWAPQRTQIPRPPLEFV
jgi:hypothetical protein